MSEKAKEQEIPNASFFDSVSKLLPRHTVQDNLRVTSKGVFVQETTVATIVETYRDWQQQASGNAEKRSIEKVERKLFGEGERTLFYVLDGKKCLPGYLMLGGVSDPQKANIPRYSANLMDTAEYLHPRDPFLLTLAGVSSRLNPKEGFILEFNSNRRSVSIAEAGLLEFARALRLSPELLEQFPEAAKSLRYCIEPLRNILAQVHEAPAGQRFIVPERYLRRSDICYLRYKTMVFVVENNRVCDCYETRGKGLRAFIRKELAALSAANSLNIRGFEAKSGRPQYLGKLWQRGISFHVHNRAFSGFLRKLSASKNLKKKLPPRITVRQLLERFIPVFQSATAVEEREIHSALGPNRKPLSKYRRSGNWLFVIVDKNVIEDCILLGAKPAVRRSPK